MLLADCFAAAVSGKLTRLSVKWPILTPRFFAVLKCERTPISARSHSKHGWDGTFTYTRETRDNNKNSAASLSPPKTVDR